MRELPLISVIVPVYKAEQYLDQCFRSIVDQTYRNLEIFLVDDGSPGNAGAICDAWAEKDSRIKVIHKENGGTGQARNVAMDAAKGDYIAFLDCDDYIAPDMYAHLYEIMDEETDIAECGFQEVYDDHAVFEKKPPVVTYYTPVDAMREHIRDNVFRQIVWNKLYRREVLEGIRFLDGIKLDDEFFTYRVIGRARKLVRTDRKCHAYRQQPNSVIHQKYSMARIAGLHAKEQRIAFLEEHMPELLEDAYTNLYFTCMYAMQMSMLTFEGEALEQAVSVIRTVMAGIPPLRVGKQHSFLTNLWIIMAKISFDGTCKLRNFLFERD